MKWQKMGAWNEAKAAPDRPDRECPVLSPAFDTSGFAPSPWVSEADYLAVRSHPALPQAVTDFAGWLIETYTNSALLNLLLSDRGRILLGFYVLYLDVLPLPGRQEPGATLSALQSLCRSTELCSPGRAASMIAIMRFRGYVTKGLDPNDQRRRTLVPQSRLISAYNLNWIRQFEAMAPLFPTAISVPGWLAQPAFRTGFLRALGTAFFAGYRVLDHAPALKPLGDMSAAILMLTGLALPHVSGIAQPGETVPVSISVLARRYSVSRAHVRNILKSAEAAALITRNSETDGVVVQPALTEALMQIYAVLFILFDWSAGMARTEMT